MRTFLSKKQRQELLNELKSEKRTRYSDRVRVILLLDQGKTYKNIAEYLFLDEGTIANYRKRYADGGIEYLINDNHQGRMTKLSEAEKKLLTKELESKIYPDTKSIVHFIEKTFGIKYTRTGVTDLLHSLGFSFKKPKITPGKANRAAQEKFLNIYGKMKFKGTVYFMDGVHPTHNTVLGYGWIRTGTDKEVKTNTGRQRVNILGAIETKTQRVISRTFKTINKDSVCEFLKLIRRRNPLEKVLYVVTDNAGYNRAKKVKRLAKELNIKLVYLPPYSPNLNPIERLWKFMKKKVMANTYYETFPDFRKNIMYFFRYIQKYRPELKTLITDNFRLMGT